MGVLRCGERRENGSFLVESVLTCIFNLTVVVKPDQPWP